MYRIICIAGLLLGCAPNGAAFPETATQLDADRSFAHDSSGDIIFGPTLINECVVAQRDEADNLHIDREATARLEREGVLTRVCRR